MAAAARASKTSDSKTILVYDLKDGSSETKELSVFFPDESFTEAPIPVAVAAFHKAFLFNESIRGQTLPSHITLDKKISAESIALGYHPDHLELGYSLLATGLIEKGSYLPYSGNILKLSSDVADRLDKSEKSKLLSHAVSIFSSWGEQYFVNAKTNGSLGRYVQHLPNKASIDDEDTLTAQLQFCLRQSTNAKGERILFVAMICKETIEASPESPALFGANYGPHYCWAPGVKPTKFSKSSFEEAFSSGSPTASLDEGTDSRCSTLFFDSDEDVGGISSPAAGAAKAPKLERDHSLSPLG